VDSKLQLCLAQPRNTCLPSLKGDSVHYFTSTSTGARYRNFDSRLSQGAILFNQGFQCHVPTSVLTLHVFKDCLKSYFLTTRNQILSSSFCEESAQLVLGHRNWPKRVQSVDHRIEHEKRWFKSVIFCANPASWQAAAACTIIVCRGYYCVEALVSALPNLVVLQTLFLEIRS
jgi:hypothetical protein